HHQLAGDGEPERRHWRGIEAYCGRDEGTLPGPVRSFLEHELRRSEQAGIWEACDRAAGAGRKKRRARFENLQEFWDGTEIRKRRARARGRSGIRRGI